MNEEEVFSGQDFGDLKQQVDELLQLTRNSLIHKNPEKVKSFLLKVKERLECCGHCNGPTHRNGVCTEHFVEY
jgi:hypothetical protein